MYIDNIIREHNKWAGRLAEIRAEEGMNIQDEGFAAFMCNAISSSVIKGTNQELKDKFHNEAMMGYYNTTFKVEFDGITQKYEGCVLLPPVSDKGRWEWFRTIQFNKWDKAYDAAIRMIDRIDGREEGE